MYIAHKRYDSPIKKFHLCVMKDFIAFFTDYKFMELLANTLSLSVLKLLSGTRRGHV